MVRYVLIDKKKNTEFKYSWIEWHFALFVIWGSGICVGLAIATWL